MSKNAIRAAGTAAAWIRSGVAAFAGPLPGFTLTAQTDRFIFYSRDAQKVNAEKSEKYLVKLEATAGPQDRRARPTTTATARPRRSRPAPARTPPGVTFPGTGEIHSTRDFHAHEIVHLVAGQIGDPGDVLPGRPRGGARQRGRWEGKDVDKLARGRVKQADDRDAARRSSSSLDPGRRVPDGGLVRARASSRSTASRRSRSSSAPAAPPARTARRPSRRRSARRSTRPAPSGRHAL